MSFHASDLCYPAVDSTTTDARFRISKNDADPSGICIVFSALAVIIVLRLVDEDEPSDQSGKSGQPHKNI